MKWLNSAIYSKLNAATTVTSLLSGTTAIYAQQAPETAVYPYLVYSVQGGGDMNETPHRVKNLVVFVRAYGTANSQVGSIDAAIDTALHLVPFSGVSGWANLWMAREQDLEMVENPPTGEQVFMNGGLYRCYFEKT